MTPVSIRDFEALARRRLDPAAWDYFAGGADDEVTLRANEAAFDGFRLLPRVLRGAGDGGTGIELLGRPAALPAIIAPTAFHKLAHPAGERATARAAARAGTIMVVSMASTMAIEEVAAESEALGGTLWCQLYPQPDQDFTDELAARAEKAGCAALVVTVDSPVFGRRERDLRNGFLDLPAGLSCATLEGRPIEFVRGLAWEHVDRLRAATSLPIVVKGVLRPDDAAIAAAGGADAIYVSNHGGRQLDTVPPAVAELPGIAAAVAGRVPVLVDGGVRRGTDVIKALALGADAVAIGRPVLWGLAADGEDGVARVLDLLRAEVDRALALCGCGSPAEVAPDLVREVSRPWPG